jgi:hypothetical protein
MGPAQGAVAGIDPQTGHAGLANKGNVGGGSRAQTGPVVGVATLFGRAGVADAGQHLLDTPGEHVAAGAGQRAVQVQVVVTDLDGAGDPQFIAQPGDGDFLSVVAPGAVF